MVSFAVENKLIRIKIEINIEVDSEEADEFIDDIAALKEVLEKGFRENESRKAKSKHR